MKFKTKFVASFEALEQFNNHGCCGGRLKVRAMRNFQKSCKEEKRLCDVYGIPYMEIKDLETLKQMEKDGICKHMLSKVK